MGIHLVTTIYRAHHAQKTDQGIKDLRGTQTVENLDAKADVVEIHTNPILTEDPVATRSKVVSDLGTDHRNSEWWGSALKPQQKVTSADMNPNLNDKSPRNKSPSPRNKKSSRHDVVRI